MSPCEGTEVERPQQDELTSRKQQSFQPRPQRGARGAQPAPALFGDSSG